MKVKASKEENFVNSSYLGDFEGTIMHFALHSLDPLSHDTWIIDIYASNQMCVNFNLIIDPKIQNLFHQYICLMDLYKW